MGIRCFLLEPTNRVRRRYRRYVSGERTCPLPFGYHNASLPLDEVDVIWETRDDSDRVIVNSYDAHDFPPQAFPPLCACGYRFQPNDQWQIFTESLYRRVDTGEVCTLRDAPPGAMWDAWWMPSYWKGSDGRSLMVKLPNGNEWSVDARASNCTLPHDLEHKCWVRHGEWPNITVDKNGLTCAAGAGSILSGDYHGFLRGGVFEP